MTDRDGLDRAVRLRRRRRQSDDRSFGRALATAGALGWTIVLPALAGVALGRWLDHRFEAGITFTAALVFAGVAGGCVLAWRRLRA